MLRLAESSHQLPSSLYVRGVDIGTDRDPVSHGGFADIFQGQYNGRTVALKRLRVCFPSESSVFKVDYSLQIKISLLLTLYPRASHEKLSYGDSSSTHSFSHFSALIRTPLR
jgi:hypothetical protein